MSNIDTLGSTQPDASGKPNAPGEFIWYELLTDDPVGAKRFYDAVVGWSIEAEPSGPMDYRMISGDDTLIGGVMRIDDAMKASGARPTWLGYLGVDDVDAATERATADGASVHVPPTDIPDVGRFAFLADPQGAMIYIMRGMTDERSDAFSVDRAQHVRWNELWSQDPAASIDFYSRHFGWVQEGDMDMGEMGKYQFLHQSGVMIGAVMPTMPDMPRSMWNFYIGVDDIDRAAEAVRSGGGQFVQEPIEIPGGDYSINAVDPRGAMFGLVGPRHS